MSKRTNKPENIEENVETEAAAIQPSAFSPQSFAFTLGAAAITALAVVVRFWQITLKPMHHDEGVNGYFLGTLFRDGIYKYDPSNYHGPTLYYIALAFTKILGLETFAVRASVAVFGTIIVIMAFALKKYIGAVGSLTAALLVALSPGMVYISRYFIHEIFFVFCSFGIALSVLFFIEGRRAGIFAIIWMTLLLLVSFAAAPIHLANEIGAANSAAVWLFRCAFFVVEAALVFLLMRALLGWNEGRPIYLLLASASAALFFATKETAFITVGTMAIAAACVWIWRKILGKNGESNELEPVRLTWNAFLARVRESNSTVLWALVVAVFLYTSALFFSSFFTYRDGLLGAFKAYDFWTNTGGTDHTQNGYAAYARWLVRLELPILSLAALGTVIAFFKGRHLFAMFAALWAFGLFLAYTIIPYKTPWLALSFILPMCLVAGYGVGQIAAQPDRALQVFAGLLVAVAALIAGYQTYDLNFVRYDSDQMPYVYAHTTRGFFGLVEAIDRYAEKSKKGKEATIQIVSPDYWSLPWYTRDYKHANYHGKIVPSNAAEMIVAKKDDQDDAVRTEYAAHYKLAGEYPLRPGVTLMLLVRRDLAEKDAKELYPELDDIPIVDVTPESAPVKR